MKDLHSGCPWLLLPLELWEKILDLVDSQGLFGLQESCRTLKDIVLSYILNGRLKHRALVSYILLY